MVVGIYFSFVSKSRVEKINYIAVAFFGWFDDVVANLSSTLTQVLFYVFCTVITAR
ncbi:MAG: hypothetical protein ACI8RD_002385 [Bacillariaceae sp.]|jgi:hypothetical protein